MVAHALAVLAALVGAVVAVALCVVGSRATTTALAPLLESRRYRAVVTIAAFVPLVLIGPAFAWLGSQLGEGPVDGDAVRGMVTSLADVAAWTPFGAPWGLGAAVHDGAWGLALARLVVALATLAVAWVVGQVARPRPRHAAHLRRGRPCQGPRILLALPATPTGAVAARTATYWLRDPRYSGSIAVVPLIPVVLLVVGGGSGSAIFLALAPFTAWILGFSISADIAYDHTAFALHVSSGVPGRADRWGGRSRARRRRGRDPPLRAGLRRGSRALGRAARAARSHRGHAAHLDGHLERDVGASALPGAEAGRQPVQAAAGRRDGDPRRPDGRDAPRPGAVAPFLVPGVIAIVADLPVLGWVTLAVGVVVGAVVLVLGVRWGARTYDRRAPELLQRVLSYA